MLPLNCRCGCIRWNRRENDETVTAHRFPFRSAARRSIHHSSRNFSLNRIIFSSYLQPSFIALCRFGRFVWNETMCVKIWQFSSYRRWFFFLFSYFFSCNFHNLQQMHTLTWLSQVFICLKCSKCLYSAFIIVFFSYSSSSFITHLFFETRPIFNFFSLAIFVGRFNFNHGHSFFEHIFVFSFHTTANYHNMLDVLKRPTLPTGRIVA